MSRSDDDTDEMTNLRPLPRLDDRAVEALLAGRAVPGWDDLVDAVGVLRNDATSPAPAPRHDLALVLEAGLPQVSAPAPAGRRVPWAARLAVGIAASTGLVLSAATANALPRPVQDAVADAVDAVTPFQLPRPATAAPVEDTDDETPTLAPSEPPAVLPVPPTAVVRPQPAPADRDDDRRAEPVDEPTDEGSGTTDSTEGPDTTESPDTIEGPDTTEGPAATGDVAPRPAAEQAPAAEQPADADGGSATAPADDGGVDEPAGVSD